MKKTKLLMLGAAIFVLLLPLGQALAQGQEDAKFQKILETYLDEYWKFYPTQATVAGYYKYNDKLEDPSQANVDKRDEIIKKINSDIIKLDRSKLSPENQQALNILFDYIDLEFVKLENLLPWDYNPLFYNEIIISGLHSLLTKEFAPADSRVRSATERLKALPNLIKRAKDNLKTPAQIYTETALKQMPHIINFYKNEAPTLAASASDPVKQAFLAEPTGQYHCSKTIRDTCAPSFCPNPRAISASAPKSIAASSSGCPGRPSARKSWPTGPRPMSRTSAGKCSWSASPSTR